MVLVKRSYQEDPIAVVFIMVAWPEVAYEIDFHKKSSNLGELVIVPVPDRSFLKSSGGLPELIWGKISRSRRWDTSRSPKSSQKIQKSKKSAIKLPIYRPSGWYVLPDLADLPEVVAAGELRTLPSTRTGGQDDVSLEQTPSN